MTEKSNITFNISGGINQILPNATEAKQVFVGDQFADDYLHQGEELPAEASALRTYINKVEILKAYLAQLHVCMTASEVAMVVVNMILDDDAPKVTREECKKERFIKTLLPVIPLVRKGLTIDNLRDRIEDAWCNRPRTKPSIST